jgi:heterodisulfide reductase subunit A
VVGGGVAGMMAALNLAGQGFTTHLVDKADRLGGQALNLYKTWKGEIVQDSLAAMVRPWNRRSESS